MFESDDIVQYIRRQKEVLLAIIRVSDFILSSCSVMYGECKTEFSTSPDLGTTFGGPETTKCSDFFQFFVYKFENVVSSENLNQTFFNHHKIIHRMSISKLDFDPGTWSKFPFEKR